MKRALISTVFNEAENLSRWWASLMQQTVLPDEIAVVDGGSNDGTWEKLQALAGTSPVPVRLKQVRCNIAAGRNQAIALTDAEIIAATDAGSFPAPEWFCEITGPLLKDGNLDICGGKSVVLAENDFQKFIEQFESGGPEPLPGAAHGSSRNIAYRRSAWADVGGYPEWLTLTAEDALFNFAMHKIGKVFYYNPAAIVRWPMRENEQQYFRMLYQYGYGWAEARLHGNNYLRHFLITIFPPLLLLSRHRLHHLRFRYGRNAACIRGWLAGWLKGHLAPAGWERQDRIFLSPEAQRCLLRRRDKMP